MSGGGDKRPRSWKRRVGDRLTDQIAWSAAFFSFNLAATLVLPTADFALLAVTTSIVFMAIAVARAWAISSRIVVATKLRMAVRDAISGRSMLWTSILMGLVLAVGVCVVSGGSSGLLIAQMVLLSFGLIAADMPRQGLIFSAMHSASLMVSLTYVGFGVVTLGLSAGFHVDPLWPWIATSYACAVVGWMYQHKFSRGNPKLPVKAARSHAWRMSAESLYTSIASQLGLLMLFWLTDPQATTGYRLSYSLVFAPAFMLLQGISPLLTIQMAGQISRNGAASLKTWFAGPLLALSAATLCGLAGWIAVEYLPVPAIFGSVVPFLIPVGLALAGAQVLEFFLMGIRYFASEHVMHRVRIVAVTVDVVAQAGGIWLGGVEGLITALVFVAAVKLVIGVAIGIVVAKGSLTRRP